MADEIHNLNGQKVNKRLLVKSGFWYTVSNFLTRAMVFITMPVFTRVMSKEEYGDFSVYSSWQTILVLICGIEIYSTLNSARFDFPNEKEFDGYITSALAMSAGFTAFMFVVYLAISSIFPSLFMMERKYMLVMFAYLFTYPAMEMFQSKQRITYKYKLSATISIVISIAAYVLALILVLMFKNDRLFGRIIGSFGLTIIAGFCFDLYFFSRSRVISKKACKYALRLGIPFVFSYIGSQIMLSSDSIIVKQMCSSELVSNLSVTHSLSRIVLILAQTLNMAWVPWFYDMLKIKKYREIKKVFCIYLFGVIFCTFAVLLIGPEVILILGGSKYAEAVWLLPPVILNGFFSVLTMCMSSFETYHKKPEYASVLTSISAVLNVILNIIGVKLWGYSAVCYTTVFCQILLIGLHYLVTQHIGINKILSLKTLISTLLLSLVMTPFAFLLYQSDAVRYGIILAFLMTILIGVVFKRNDLMRLIKMLVKDRGGAVND